MPLEHGAKAGTPGFGRNIATEYNAGKPQKQAVAIAYSEAKRTRDAPARVGVLSGNDPEGSHELQPVPRMPPRAAQAGAVNPAGLPVTTQMPEPYPQSPSPPIVSKNVHPQQRIPVLGETTAVRDEDYSSAPEGSTVENIGEGAPTASSETGSEGGLSSRGMTDDLAETNATEAEGHGMLENAMKQSHPATAESVVDEHVGFKAVEKHAAAEGAHDPAAVAAAVGIKKYGVVGMERKAKAGRK